MVAQQPHARVRRRGSRPAAGRYAATAAADPSAGRWAAAGPGAGPVAPRPARTTSRSPARRRYPAPSSPYRRSTATSRSSTSLPYRVGCLVSTSSRIGRPRPRPRCPADVSRVSTRAAESSSGSSSVRRPAGVPGAEVQLVELRQGVLADRATAVAGALQPAVVQADQVPVAGQPDVALQPVGALVDGAQVRAEGVLGQRVRRSRGGRTPGALRGRQAHPRPR